MNPDGIPGFVTHQPRFGIPAVQKLSIAPEKSATTTGLAFETGVVMPTAGVIVGPGVFVPAQPAASIPGIINPIIQNGLLRMVTS